MPKDKRPKIAVCLPCYGFVPETFFRNFIYSLYEWNKNDMRIEVIMNSAIPVDKSRNVLVSQAVNKGADYVFFIDTDVLIPDDCLKKLLAMDKDIATGIYFQKGPPYRPVLRTEVDGRYFFWDEILPRDQVFKVAGSGLGCCLIKTKIFKKMKFPYFKFNWEEWRGIEGQGAEDLYFCKEARKQGYEIWAHSGVLCGHVGGVVSYDNYIQYEPAVKRLNEDRDEIIEDMMEWYGYTNRFEALAQMKKGALLVADEWIAKKVDKNNPESIKQFYKNCESYVWDLTNWHFSNRRDFDDRLVQEMMKFNPKSVLDYGCGIGQNAFMIKKYAQIERVICADLKSRTLDFAKTRAKKRGYDIKFWETDTEDFNEQVDVILCFDVLEHLTDDEFKKVVEKLISLKHKDTRVYLSISWGESKSHPMHMEDAEWKMKLINKLVIGQP